MTTIAELGVIVRGQGVRETARDLEQFNKSADKAQRTAVTMGKAIGGALVAGFGTAALVMRSYIANSIEAERVQAQLNATLKSTKGAAGLAIGELNKMSTALQSLTSFDDESIGEVQALLLTFTKVGRENFQRATEAALDLSTAMGTDLKSAALQVGKALNDPVKGLTALSRAGIQFSESQRDAITQLVETGRVAEAQKMVLQELEKQVGGTSRAFRDTLGGAMKALKVTVGNLLEGDSGSGGLQGLRNAVEDLNRSLNDPAIKRGLSTIAEGMLAAANGAIRAAGAIGALRESFGSLNKMELTTLRNRKTDLESQLFAEQRAQRKSWLGAGAVENAPRVMALKAEIAETARLIAVREKAERADAKGNRFSPAYEAASLNFNPNPRMGTLDVGTGKVEGTRKQAAAVRDATAALRDYASEESTIAAILARTDDERFRAIESWAALSAELGGPLKMAEFEHIQRMTEIQRLGQTAGIVAEEIAAAKAKEAAAYRDATAAMLEQQKIQSNPEAIRLMDSFRMGAVDALTDIVTGAKSAKDAMRDFFDDLAAQVTRAIASQLMDQLFGPLGTSGTGSKAGSGLFGIFTSLFGSLLTGGGFAKGGYTGDGPANEIAGVVHRGEYVIPAETVKRLRSGGGEPEGPGAGSSHRGPAQVHQTINVQGKIDRRSASQIAMETGREVARAQRRYT